MTLFLVLVGVGLGFAALSSRRSSSASPPASLSTSEQRTRAAARLALMVWAAANRTRYGDPPGGVYIYTPADAGIPWNDRDRWVLSQWQRQENPMGSRTDGELDASTFAALQAWAKSNYELAKLGGARTA